MGRDGASSLFYIQVSLLCDRGEIPPGLKVRMVTWVRSGICSVSVHHLRGPGLVPTLLRMPSCSQSGPSTACPGCLAACPPLCPQAALPTGARNAMAEFRGFPSNS